MPLRTALTDRLGLRYPVLGAPIGRGATPRYIQALADAGALGFMPLTHVAKPEVRQVLSSYIAAAGGGDRFGINLTLVEDQMERLDSALASGCKIVSIWHGQPEAYVRRARDAGALVFWTVGSPEQASRAADMGVDFLVCQGREAGGHLVGLAPLMALLPAVVDAARGVPVVAAGGISDGRGLAAAICLGACGVWLGSRFVASVESDNHPGYKQRIVDAGFSDLVETTLFDGGWADAPHQVIRNSTYANWENAGCPNAGARPGEGAIIASFSDGRAMQLYDSASPWGEMKGDWRAMALYAGSSVGLVREIVTIPDILAAMEQDAEAIFHRQKSQALRV